MLWTGIFVVLIVCIVWGLVSLCVAVYYTGLLRHEARRRWPVVERDGCCALAASPALFLFAILCWPGILVWDYCARYCVGAKSCCGIGPGGCCLRGWPWMDCEPCISDEVRCAEKERRTRAHRRAQQAFGIVREVPPALQPAMEMPARLGRGSKDSKGSGFTNIELDISALGSAHPPGSPPPLYIRETAV